MVLQARHVGSALHSRRREVSRVCTGGVDCEVHPQFEGPHSPRGLDPEPEQPGGMIADNCLWCRAHGYVPGQQLTHEGVPPAEPGPRRFEAPPQPPGVTRVTDPQGDAYWLMTSGPKAGLWMGEGGVEWVWSMLLGSQGPLTDATPPRKPRTWKQLEPTPDNISDVIEVRGQHYRVAVRRQLGQTTFVHLDEHGTTGAVTFTLGHLREIGDVTEVFDGA